MEFWYLWLIGWGLVIVTRIAINIFVKNRGLYKDNKAVRVIINMLVSVCIIIVGGILVGEIIGSYGCEDKIGILDVGAMIIVGLVVAVITFIVGYFILGLKHLENDSADALFIVIFIISIIAWSITIWGYNQNIEKTTETNIQSQEERELIYFCNIPVQEISGGISGSRHQFSGNISTDENLPYWYLNEKGQGVYDSASTEKSKLIFIEDGETPYVEVFHYCSKTFSVNNNNNSKEQVSSKEWNEYCFYVPKSIMEQELIAEF